MKKKKNDVRNGVMRTSMCDDNEGNDLFEYCQRFCNPNFEKWKNKKSGLVPMLRQKKLVNLFLVFSTRLET